MTKWFNTNYHYLVPEFSATDEFELKWNQLFDEIESAQKLGHQTKPQLLGPVSYLYLGKEVESGFSRLELLPKIIKAYQQILSKLGKLDVEWLQIDEPILALELTDEWKKALKQAYAALSQAPEIPNLLLTTYFDSVDHQVELIKTLPVDGIHLDLISNDQNLAEFAKQLPDQWVISAGVINGRNVWKTDLEKWLTLLKPIKHAIGERLWLATSCSLLHSPVNLDSEIALSDKVKSWFSFAQQKLNEVTLLAQALDGDAQAVRDCQQYSQAIKDRANSKEVNKKRVQQRLTRLTELSTDRELPYVKRAKIQQDKLQLPLLPTTTIGSFPQTQDIRRQRNAFRKGDVPLAEYELNLQQHISDAVKRQEALDLDVLVHGEAERNDMVEYFAENLDGFVTTQFGWVQSYGSRCVKPAIVVADVERPKPISVKWTAYAQSLTTKQMKGMLTGPVTILMWTFPREDISKQEIANQIAFALNDEVADLQASGINIIQIDEPAIREGLPLKTSEHKTYLNWAVNAFKLSALSAKSETQIHTHMCYSEFNEIIESVAALDADVITIETSRSNMELLNAFEKFDYPNEIGPGVYDIHSPNIPDEEWMISLLERAAQKIPLERLWVNPDCGLKTRTWKETEEALKNMVSAAKRVRQRQGLISEELC
jgi:5-methyltetrahydropteroyltriglutamate--homocysteine methyltransferase